MEYALAISAFAAMCWWVRAATVQSNFERLAVRYGGQFASTGAWSSGRLTLQIATAKVIVTDEAGPLCWSPRVVLTVETALPNLSGIPWHLPRELQAKLAELRRLTGDREPSLEIGPSGARLVLSASAYFDGDLAMVLPTALATMRELLPWLANLARKAEPFTAPLTEPNSAGPSLAPAESAKLGELLVSPEAADCPVCGEPLSRLSTVGQLAASACLCPVCRTPHHLDCWQYNRGCAVYGCRCGSRALRSAGKPPRAG